MKNRFLILILILVLMLSGCEVEMADDSVLGAYGNTEQEQELTPDSADVTLLFYPDMDTNPVTTTCLANNQILKLVYQPLIRLNESFKPECVLAESFSQSGDTVTVVIKSSAKFSDGSAVTASDAVKSVNVAKKNESSPYYASAALIKKCYAKDERTVVFEFTNELADAAGLLDIPVMKEGKEGIGSGPYIFSELNGKRILAANGHYPKTPGVSVLHLVETKTDEYVTTLFSAGELDVLSLPGGDDLSLTSLRNYSTLAYPSNNLVYIGVNTNNELFADGAVRRAISSCIDRTKLAKQTLVDLCEPTVYPFNPSYYKMNVYNIEANPAQTADTKTLEGKELKLLVSEQSDVKVAVANALVESFKSLGITLTLEMQPLENYKARVMSGDFDLYLGETAVPRTMDPTFLFGTGGSMNYCGYSNAELDTAFEQYQQTGTDLDKCLEVFSENMPIIPIAFRKNVMYTTEILEGFSEQTAWDSYGNFENVKIKK